jgi:hypothetical protein
LRADGEFAKPDLLDYAEYAGCSYAIGMPRNPKLEARAQRLSRRSEQRWQQTSQPVRLYNDFFYQAQSWSHPRRIAVKCEVTALGVNLRFVVTNRAGTPEQIFDWYNLRGQAEILSRSSRTISPPTASPALPTAPTLSGFSSTLWPTISWRCFAAWCSAAPNSLAPPSRSCACACSSSALGSSARFAACGFTSPAAGLVNHCSAPCSGVWPRSALPDCRFLRILTHS